MGMQLTTQAKKDKGSMKKEPSNVLPLSCPPRGLSRIQAAEYIGVSPSLFDEMVADGRMPGPKRINSRVTWDRVRLDAAFDALPDRDDTDDDSWKVAA